MINLSALELGIAADELKLQARGEVKRRMWTEVDDTDWYGLLSRPVALAESLENNLSEPLCGPFSKPDATDTSGAWA